jgi:hypothetical protein
MKFIPKLIIAGYLLLMLYACRQPLYYGHENDYFRPVDTQYENNQNNLNDEKNINKERENCIQGIPQRVIDTNVLSGAEYNQIDFIGYEKIILPTGDKLLIINWGCTTYNLTFRFETSRFGTDTSKVKYWYNTLAQLLGLVEPVIKSPVNIRQGINEIHNFLKQDTLHPDYNIPLNINNDSTYIEMVFEKAKVLSDTAVRLDITFSLGKYLQKP